MAKQKNHLYKLVKSLDRAEKRHFRLFVGRTKRGEEALFLQLFDLLDKSNTYSEDKIREKLPGKVSKGQFANLKRHLNKQLLTSLRLLLVNRHIDIEIREQLDFARILYSKGHYMESLHRLERIKGIAKSNNQDILHLEILEFQKLIEARHVTRSRQVARKMDSLLKESTERSIVTQTASVMMNLNIQIHGYYIEHGFAIKEDEITALKQAWQYMQPELFHNRFQDTFNEKANRIQAYLWYRYILTDCQGALNHAYEWANLFALNPKMILYDPDLYMRSLYYLMVFLFLTNQKTEFPTQLQKLDTFIAGHQHNFNKNSQQVAFVYQGLSQLNYYILTEDFQQGIQVGKSIIGKLPLHSALMDQHRILLFDYKMAAIYFALGKYQDARTHLSQMLHYRQLILQRDMDINARLLELMCLYETQDYDFMHARITSLARSMGKETKSAPLQLATLTLLRDLYRAQHANQKQVFQKHAVHFQEAQSMIDQIFLKYLDVNHWIAQHL